MEGCGQIDVILRRVLALPHRAVIEPEQLEAHGLPGRRLASVVKPEAGL